ncbi:hypothetical protein N8987_01255 [Crocinitomix sp.]|nr:hypothetical protein [Crocinitomix sp.]
MILKQFFSALSYIFHPLFMPILGVYILLMVPSMPITFNRLDALYYFPPVVKQYLFIVLGILTIIAPLLSLIIMYYNRIITNFKLEVREERFYPYLLVAFYYLLAYFFVRKQLPLDYQHPALLGFLFGILLVVIICLLLNFYIKISLHAAAIYGVCGMLIGYSQTQLSADLSGLATNIYIILYLLLVAALVTGARAYLKSHKIPEILIGGLIGFTITFFTVKYGIYI